jgi:cytochrome b involved in lipid metabolism
MSKSFTANDVASHNKPDNLYIIVDHDVYDLTKFQEEHPGGKKSSRPAEFEGGTVANLYQQSSNELPAKMPASSSGNTTTSLS